ncbi:hypothetical protein MMC34_008561 [Xylographa carneopallida]|nr:hypothetical protein [Xylographa carneopallida]
MSGLETSFTSEEGKEETVAPTLPRVGIDRQTTTATGSTQPIVNTSAVHFHSADSATSARGRRPEVEDNRGVWISHSELRQMRERGERNEKRLAELEAARSSSNIAADMLRTPISANPLRAGTVAAQRQLYMPAGGIAVDDDSDSEIAASAQRVERTQVRASSEPKLPFDKALNIIIKAVKPFYGDSSRDTKYQTVTEFVERAENLMANMLSVEDDNKRLMVISVLVEGYASTWLTHKMHELTETDTTERDFIRRPLTWDDDLRRPFLYAFLGTNTPELWIAKLQMLKLGDEKTSSPIELENQFDAIARHAFPQLQIGSTIADTMLAPYWGDIVKKETWLYTTILRAHGIPRTLKKWKQALAEAYIADQQIKAMYARTAEAKRGKGGSFKPAGRGGKASQGGQSAPQQSVSAMYDDEYERSEGEQETDTTQQSLAASPAAGGSGRGGRGGAQRGGRAGRGRGGGGANLTPVQKQMYGRGECFVCGKTGHLQYQCPERTMDQPSQQQQSNAVAGQ